MNDPRRFIVLMWFVAIGLVAAREIRTAKALPNPAAMVKGSVVFSILAVLGEFAGPFAAALSVGYVIALLMVPGLLPTPPVSSAAKGAAIGVGNVTQDTNVTNTARAQGGAAA